MLLRGLGHRLNEPVVCDVYDEAVVAGHSGGSKLELIHYIEVDTCGVDD